ncbi:MAG: SCO1664 family protein [Actinomycetota bacterium]
MSRDERALGAGLSDPAVPDVLATGELEILGRLPNASNHTFLARARLNGDELLVVYKPRRGEAPLWDFPEGTLCVREVATYVVARTLGWPNVPATVLRDGPFGVGSAQRFVPFDPDEHYFTLAERFVAEFRRVAAFDLVINNADRKAGHCLLGEDGRIYVVDHGVCFSEEPKLRTVIWDFVGDPVEEQARADVARLTDHVREGPVRDELANLLSEAELDTLAARARSVAELERLPDPGTDHRPFPWPPI